VAFEPTITASARPQTYALDRAAAGIGTGHFTEVKQLPLLPLVYWNLTADGDEWGKKSAATALYNGKTVVVPPIIHSIFS
jgi:hypothetical protein